MRDGDTYPCWELLNFWRNQPGGLRAMPQHLWDYIAGNRGEQPPWDVRDRTVEENDDECPF